MFKSASRFRCGIRPGKGISLRKQKSKDDWENGVKVLDVKIHSIDTQHFENTSTISSFIPKTVVMTKEERSIHLISELNKMIEHLKYKSTITTNKSKIEATRRVNDLIDKLARFRDDKIVKTTITEARKAITEYCKRKTIRVLKTPEGRR